jgi:hypothetical protein
MGLDPDALEEGWRAYVEGRYFDWIAFGLREGTPKLRERMMAVARGLAGREVDPTGFEAWRRALARPLGLIRKTTLEEMLRKARAP